MEKPLILRKLELKDDVLNAIDNAKLPAHEILPFIESLHRAIQQQATEEYHEAMQKYNEEKLKEAGDDE